MPVVEQAITHMNEVYKGTFNYHISKDSDFWGRYEITVSKVCNTDCSSVGVENEIFLHSKVETSNILYDRPAFLEKFNHAIALKAQRIAGKAKTSMQKKKF